jgi:hypothetical protein
VRGALTVIDHNYNVNRKQVNIKIVVIQENSSGGKLPSDICGNCIVLKI